MLDVEKIMIINERMDRMLAMMFNAPINAGKCITFVRQTLDGCVTSDTQKIRTLRTVTPHNAPAA